MQPFNSSPADQHWTIVSARGPSKSPPQKPQPSCTSLARPCNQRSAPSPTCNKTTRRPIGTSPPRIAFTSLSALPATVRPTHPPQPSQSAAPASTCLAPAAPPAALGIKRTTGLAHRKTKHETAASHSVFGILYGTNWRSSSGRIPPALTRRDGCTRTVPDNAYPPIRIRTRTVRTLSAAQAKFDMHAPNKIFALAQTPRRLFLIFFSLRREWVFAIPYPRLRTRTGGFAALGLGRTIDPVGWGVRTQ
jgi:hypothetical protein